MKYTKAVDYLYEKIPLDTISQISKEIDWFINFYDAISPAMFVSYDRTAYFCTDIPDLRITFDANITYRTNDLMLSKGVYGKKIIDANEKLMEIKIPNAMPVWLADTLSSLEIFPTSFSKYGRGYIDTLINDTSNNQGGMYCA